MSLQVLSSVLVCLTSIEFWHPLGTPLVDCCAMRSEKSCDCVVAEYSVGSSSVLTDAGGRCNPKNAASRMLVLNCYCRIAASQLLHCSIAGSAELLFKQVMACGIAAAALLHSSIAVSRM